MGSRHRRSGCWVWTKENAPGSYLTKQTLHVSTSDVPQVRLVAVEVGVVGGSVGVVHAYGALKGTHNVQRPGDVHLVAVEVGVVGGAVGVVHADGALPLQHAHPMRHDAGFVQSRLPVHKQHVAVPQVPWSRGVFGAVGKRGG
eukprot:4406093-Pyramimonas_sp.AAC.1